MESVLPVLFYIFGISTFVVMTILGIRMIQILNKVEKIADNIDEKVNSLNGFFNVINKATNSIDLISSKIVGSIVGVIDKIFKRKKEEDNYE